MDASTFILNKCKDVKTAQKIREIKQYFYHLESMDIDSLCYCLSCLKKYACREFLFEIIGDWLEINDSNMNEYTRSECLSKLLSKV